MHYVVGIEIISMSTFELTNDVSVISGIMFGSTQKHDMNFIGFTHYCTDQKDLLNIVNGSCQTGWLLST